MNLIFILCIFITSVLASNTSVPWYYDENPYTSVREFIICDSHRKTAPFAKLAQQVFPTYDPSPICGPLSSACPKKCTNNEDYGCDRCTKYYLIGPPDPTYKLTHRNKLLNPQNIPFTDFTKSNVRFQIKPMCLDCPFSPNKYPLRSFSLGNMDIWLGYIYETQGLATNSIAKVFTVIPEFRVRDQQDGVFAPLDRQTIRLHKNEVADMRQIINLLLQKNNEPDDELFNLFSVLIDDGHSYGLTPYFNQIGKSDWNISTFKNSKKVSFYKGVDNIWYVDNSVVNMESAPGKIVLTKGSDNSIWIFNDTEIAKLNASMFCYASQARTPEQGPHRAWANNSNLIDNMVAMLTDTFHENLSPGYLMMKDVWENAAISTSGLAPWVNFPNANEPNYFPNVVNYNTLQVMLWLSPTVICCKVNKNQTCCDKLHTHNIYEVQKLPTGRVSFQWWHKPGGNTFLTFNQIVQTLDIDSIGDGSSSSAPPSIESSMTVPGIYAVNTKVLIWLNNGTLLQATKHQLSKASWNHRVYVSN